MTILASSVVVGNSYKLTMTVPAIMGTAFNNAKILSGGCTYAVAKSTSTDIFTEHLQQLASLPNGTNTDPTKLTYIIIETNTGVVRALAVDWITSATLMSSVDANIKITNTDQTTLALITAYLTKLGVNYTVS